MSNPSSVAANAISADVGQQAPGWEYKLCLNGSDYADAPSGFAQIGALLTPAEAARSGAPLNTGLKMANDTIIHVASMSKPVCVTAFVAMLDDWRDLANGVKGTGPLAATTGLAIRSATPPIQPLPIQGTQVPLWLVPALFSAPLAAQLVNAGLLTIVPQSLHNMVNAVAFNGALCSMVELDSPRRPSTEETPAAGLLTAVHPRASRFPAEIQPLPGYASLLTQVIKGVAVPQPTDYFLPYIQSSLQAKATALGVPYQVGQGMASVTIGQLITHTSAIPNGFTDLSAVNPSLVTFTQPVQPTNGGPVTCDIWAYLLAFVSQPANGQPGYKNDDYNILGEVVAACVGMLYDDYVYARLFSDPQFGALRRYVTDVLNSSDYYTGTGPNFSAGNPFPDYRGFGACGGFYYTADQITQWMYTLYSGASVQRATGTGPSGPLVSQTGRNMLFGTTAYFSAGNSPTAGNVPPLSSWITYPHNGGTTVGNGSCNGEMAIAVGPNGDVMTAFFCANGTLNADVPFNDALQGILTSAYPPAG